MIARARSIEYLRLGDNPSDPNQVHWLVGVVQCGLRRPVPADRSVEVVASVGMQLDLRFEPHHVVGQHRDLRPEQLPIRLLRPRPLGGLRLTAPAPPPHQQPGRTGTADEHHREHPAAATAIVVTAVAGPSGRTRGVTHTFNKVVEHRGGVVAVGFERRRRQLGGLAGRQLATPGAEAVADDDTERAVVDRRRRPTGWPPPPGHHRRDRPPTPAAQQCRSACRRCG